MADFYINSSRFVELPGFQGVCVICRFDLGKFNIQAFQDYAISRPSQLSKARSKRLAEYFAGRYAAKLALNSLQMPESDIPIGANNAPEWPGGVVGSISHTNGVAVCALSRSQSRTQAFVGIDVERPLAVDSAKLIEPTILENNESKLVECEFDDNAQGIGLAFSSKECVYKSFAPGPDRLKHPHNFQITAISAAEKRFYVNVSEQSPGELPEISRIARWYEHEDLLISYCV